MAYLVLFSVQRDYNTSRDNLFTLFPCSFLAKPYPYLFYFCPSFCPIWDKCIIKTKLWLRQKRDMKMGYLLASAYIITLQLYQERYAASTSVHSGLYQKSKHFLWGFFGKARKLERWGLRAKPQPLKARGSGGKVS